MPKTRSLRKYRRQQKRALHRLHIHQLGWHKHWRRWRYKNTTLLIMSLITFLFIATTPVVQEIIGALGRTGYIGAFFVGMLFVSVFTTAPAAVVLYNLANTLHPVEIALIAGLGSMFGDYLIFRFLRDNIFQELTPLFEKVTTHKITKLYYTPYFAWMTPIIGMIFIASPGPDEIGISILGLSKIKQWQFMLVTFALNFFGILLVVLAAQAI
jgi:hypothetical protein